MLKGRRVSNLPSINQSLETHSGLQLVDSDTPQTGAIFAFIKLLHTLPIIGHPVASLIEKSFSNGTDSVQRMPDIDAADLLALQAAIAEVSRVLIQGNQTLGASSVQSVSPTAISNGENNSTSAALANPTNTTSSVSPPSAAVADGSTMTGVATFTQTPFESTSAPQWSPTTPTIPGNPPNTPVPPTTTV
jgi:hypothetical protein